MTQNDERPLNLVERMSAPRTRLLLLDIMNSGLDQLVQDFSDLLRMRDQNAERRIEEVNAELYCNHIPIRLCYTNGQHWRTLMVVGYTEHDREFIGVELEVDVDSCHAPALSRGVLHKGWLHEYCGAPKAYDLLVQLLTSHLDPSAPKVSVNMAMFR